MENKKSTILNTLSLSKVVLGTTLVSYPCFFKDNGIIPVSISIILIGGVLCSTTLYFLYASSKATKAKTYEELGEKVLGRTTRGIIKGSVFLIGYFCLIIYINLCSEFIQSLIKVHSIISKVGVSILCGILSSFSRVKFLNLLGLSSIFILLLTVVTQFIRNFKSLNLKEINFTEYETNHFHLFGFVSICFCSHFVIIPFMQSIEESENKPKIIISSSFLSVLVYLSVGVFGYLAFPNTHSNWAMNPLNNPFLSFTLSLILISVIVLSYPLCVIASKDILMGGDSSVGRDRVCIWFLTLSSCLLSTFLKDFFIINTLFLSFGSLVMFIYPTIFYFKVVQPSGGLLVYLLGGLSFTLGVIMMLMSLVEFGNRLRN